MDENTENLRAWGLLVQDCRERLGMTQDDVADAVTRQLRLTYPGMKVGRGAVSKWERGVNLPEEKSLRALAQVLGVEHDALLLVARGQMFGSLENIGFKPEPRPAKRDRRPDREATISAYGHLSPSSRAAVDALITQLLVNDGLDPDDPDPDA